MIYQHFPIFKVSYPGVNVTEESKYILIKDKGRNVILRKFNTPLGEISVQHEFIIDDIPTPGDLIQKFGSEINQENFSWVTKYPFKKESDYEILEFIYGNTFYKPNYNEFIMTENIWAMVEAVEEFGKY